MAMTLIMLAIFVVMVAMAMTYPEGARFQPLVVGLPAIGLCLVQLAIELRPASRGPPRGAGSREGSTQPTTAGAMARLVSAGEPEAPPSLRRELTVWSYFLGLIAGVLLVGFWVALPVFLVLFLALEARIGWGKAVVSGLGATVVLYGVFVLGLRVSLHDGFLLQYFRAAGALG